MASPRKAFASALPLAMMLFAAEDSFSRRYVRAMALSARASKRSCMGRGGVPAALAVVLPMKRLAASSAVPRIARRLDVSRFMEIPVSNVGGCRGDAWGKTTNPARATAKGSGRA